MNNSNLQRLLMLLCLVYLSAVKAQNSSAHWSYENPNNWGDDYPICNGNRQSPISLRARESFLFPMAPVTFINYDTALAGNVTLVNNGHSVEFFVPATTNGQRPTIAGGILRGRYEAVNVHFHWGSRNSRGSEHVIEGVRFDVEMHVVHKNVAYGSVAEASKHSDGLAVLGVMFKIVEEPFTNYAGLYNVLDQLPNVVYYNSSANIPDRITLSQMLGDLNTKRFFTYSGSLTTPNCAEAVTWIVFPNALPVARYQIEKFWSILDDNGNPLINNYRPLQNRNGRSVFYRSTLIF